MAIVRTITEALTLTRPAGPLTEAEARLWDMLAKRSAPLDMAAIEAAAASARESLRSAATWRNGRP